MQKYDKVLLLATLEPCSKAQALRRSNFRVKSKICTRTAAFATRVRGRRHCVFRG